MGVQDRPFKLYPEPEGVQYSGLEVEARIIGKVKVRYHL